MQRLAVIKAFLVLATLLWTNASGFAQDMLKLAIGQRGLWETAVSELGQGAGIFKKHGLVLEALYTQGAGETQQPVISGSVDIGVSVGTFGALGAYAKGAPIRVIGATMTGANDLLWYVPANSPIKTIKDTAGKTVAYSTSGSSTHQTVLAFAKYFGVALKPVAAGGPPATFTQVMSEQIDVGWLVLPFGLGALEEGKIRIIAKASDIPSFRDQTIRVLIANADKLKSRRDLFVRYMRAYRETLDWMYSDPAALAAYAKWAKIPETLAPRVRAMSPKEDLNPDRISGLDGVMNDAVTFKYMHARLSEDQLSALFAVPLN